MDIRGDDGGGKEICVPPGCVGSLEVWVDGRRQHPEQPQTNEQTQGWRMMLRVVTNQVYA